MSTRALTNQLQPPVTFGSRTELHHHFGGSYRKRATIHAERSRCERKLRRRLLLERPGEDDRLTRVELGRDCIGDRASKRHRLPDFSPRQFDDRLSCLISRDSVDDRQQSDLLLQPPGLSLDLIRPEVFGESRRKGRSDGVSERQARKHHDHQSEFVHSAMRTGPRAPVKVVSQ